MVCEKLKQLIERYGYKILNSTEDGNKCLIDFIHPEIEIKPPVAYYASSVLYDKKRKSLETTVRGKVERFKELYLDYCCEKEKGECLQVCRPHVNMEEKILSVEATFSENPFKKFGRLLEELRW